MADHDMNLYRTDSATFELPTMLKDRTMHMFTLGDDGPSEFSIVISHTDLQPGERLEEFRERLVSEMDRALPKFELEGVTERVVDRAPAVELAYRWRNDGHTMHQRQIITVVQGRSEASTRAMLIAATCLKPFSEDWNSAFDAAVASIKLRQSETVGSAAGRSSAAEEPEYIFVLSDRRRTLRVFANHGDACRNTDAREVEQDAWSFFDATGLRLYPKFIVPNTGTFWKRAGRYLLEARPGLPRQQLRERLDGVAILQNSVPSAPFTSIGDVRAFLDKKMAG